MSVLPKVSIILPILNGVDYIQECLKSIVKQTLKEIEVICVDAGSTDGTLEILREYAQNDSRISITLSERKSYGYQMNLGLQIARGEYIGIVEGDDYILPDMYESLYTIAVKEDLDIIKSDYKIFLKDSEQRIFTYCSSLANEFIRKSGYYNTIINPQENLKIFYAKGLNQIGIYKNSFIKNNQIFFNQTPGASYQDNGFWFQTFMYAQKIYFLDKAFYMLRRDNPNSSVNDINKVYCLCEEYDFIRSLLRKDIRLEEKYASLCARFRFGNYVFTLKRIAPQSKLEFLRRFSQEFRWIDRHNELEQELYSSHDWNILQLIMKDPDKYYYDEVQKKGYENVLTLKQQLQNTEKELKWKQKEISDLKRSTSFRVGRLVTFLPRKIRGGVRCCKEHGAIYTCNYILKLTKQRYKKNIKSQN